MRVVIASDKWKGSLSSRAVGEHIAAGLRKAMPGARPNVLSVADGGDGSVDAALAAGFDQREMRVPDGRGAGYRCSTAWRGGDVVLEVAQLGGIARRSPDPLGASSHALGHALRIAAARGATRAFVGLAQVAVARELEEDAVVFAQHALALDPSSGEAKRLVERLQERAAA